jgi:protease I
MANQLQGKKVAFLAADAYEESELKKPWQALHEAGAELSLVSLEDGEITALDEQELKPGATHPVDLTVEEAKADDFDALVLPGGVMNPDKLRADENAVHFVRRFFEQGKPVGAICHGPWTLVEAGVLRGRTVTSYP